MNAIQLTIYSGHSHEFGNRYCLCAIVLSYLRWMVNFEPEFKSKSQMKYKKFC